MPATDAAVMHRVAMSPTDLLDETREAEQDLRQSSKLSYMHRPPTIMPNYGASSKGGVKLKTKVNRVLLYDNVTQQSILRAQISDIQSQRYKTSRQMESNLKAFLLQRQRKDRFLRKLTKVRHDEDYVQFELDYYGLSRPVDRSLKEGRDNNSTLTAGQSVVGVLVRNVLNPIKKHKYKHYNPTSLINEGANGGPLERSVCQASNNDAFNNRLIGLLPSITSHRPHAANQQRLSRSVLHLVPLSNLNFRVQKSYSKNTEMLRAKHNRDELTVSEEAEDDQGGLTKFTNNEHACAVTISDDTLFTNQLPLKKNRASVGSTDTFGELASSSRTFDGNMKEPVLDYRFELLQKVLVRQDPPNDGFNELSPSFVKRNSFQFVADKHSYLHIEEPQPPIAGDIHGDDNQTTESRKPRWDHSK